MKEPALPNMTPEDFERLCQSIEGSISKVMNVVEKGLDKAGDAANNAINQAMEKQKQRNSGRPTQAATTNKNAYFAQYSKDAIAKRNAETAIVRSRFKSTAGLTATGVTLTSLGAIFTTSFGVADIASIVGLPFISDPTLTGPVIGGVIAISAFLGLSIWSLVAGVRRLSLARKAKAFQRIFGDREVCSIKELSERTQTDPQRTLAIARKLIRFGMLPQGRIDDDGTCLMVTNESYSLYLQAKHEYDKRLAEERAAREAKRRAGIGGSQTPTAKANAFIGTGNDFIGQITALNVAIDDAQLSEQIVQIETVIGQILDRVRSNPDLLDTVSGLDRLNDYYLPQTVKLLTAYEELEEQPIQGENIVSSRREIEGTLEVLCTAYNKLLDSTFQDLSMDVSSDISVLHAILAQEGLTETPFDADADTGAPDRSAGATDPAHAKS